MKVLQDYSAEWPRQYEQEVNAIKQAIPEIIDIQHIGSTAIPGMVAKPIIDIAILIKSVVEVDRYIKPLESLGYQYFPESSSVERHFFRKGDPVLFHLSLAYQDQGNYWDRQIRFRDFLREHEQSRIEYIQLKQDLLKHDPTAGKTYLLGKTPFIEGVLARSRK